MVLTQLIMVAIMTMTPIHMQHHGHDVSAAGLVIAVHVAGMYLPSPFSGLLVDRFGRMAVAAASGVTLLGAGLLAALAPPNSVVLLAFALALLGLGWNFGLVSGTAIITDTVPWQPAPRPRARSTSPSHSPEPGAVWHPVWSSPPAATPHSPASAAPSPWPSSPLSPTPPVPPIDDPPQLACV
ncbi:MFS transporter [Saccharopolyspora spinosa]|uniref:MFS transporter n=1 Tax=Saccharopolyspora spinosa TaxID=60894 RepID=UPI00376EF323